MQSRELICCTSRERASPRRHCQLGVRYPKLAILYSWYSCICKSRHRALTCNVALGRVAPKLACVQDIRPHVPELGCTSAVQNEKYIFFIFVLLMCDSDLEYKPEQALLRLRQHHYQLGVRYPKLAILFVVFMYLQVKASSLDLQM